MRKIVLLFFSLFLLMACLPVFDSMEQMWIENQTNDTILIGNAHYNTIDSVKWFLVCKEAKFDSTWTKIDDIGNLVFSRDGLIPPDSLGCYARTTLFGHSQDHKGYFFIIKLENAKKYSWKEICEKQLYDTMVVTQEMLENNKSRIFEYKGGK